jgi:putative phage-type endonuclease
MITEQQRQNRKRYIGSSDIAAIIGLNPWRTAADVFLEKTDQLDDDKSNPSIDAGNKFEAVILESISDIIGKPIDIVDTMIDASGLCCANLDGKVRDEFEVAEAKYSASDDGWGEQGTGDVPPRVAAQCQFQLAVGGEKYRRAHVGLMLAGFRKIEFRYYCIERDNAVAEGLLQAGINFMRNHVIPRVPPADFKPTEDVIRRLRRIPNTTVEIAADVIDKLAAARKAKSEAAKACDEVELAVKTMLGTAEAGVTPGGRMLTFFESPRKGYTVAAGVVRTLRIKEPKD